VAGDFYDAFMLPTGDIAVVVADVCDKGVPAALFMAVSRSLLRAIAAQQFDGAGASVDTGRALCATIAATNDYIANTHGGTNMFATMFVAVLETSTGRLRFVNGGHEPPAVVGAGGAVRARLQPTGPAVGMMPGLPFIAGEELLAPGELLLAYTDGVTDARGPAGESFGETRLLACSSESSAQRVVSSIQQSLDDFIAGADAFDDVTLLAVRRA
jgi:serine phosphatase RsbU (regulator of sigma subunit)